LRMNFAEVLIASPGLEKIRTLVLLSIGPGMSNGNLEVRFY
jgi:hypothetical protein